MPEARTIPVKYIFMDIVGFTKDRSVEAQSDLVEILNRLVLETIQDYGIKDEARIFVPTGDGICIAFLNVTEPYDIHIQIAVHILGSIHQHNEQTSDAMRSFQVRIGKHRQPY